jgi:FlaA1/EpsC-like NDP-sugar epimerase
LLGNSIFSSTKSDSVDILTLIGRSNRLFHDDIAAHEHTITQAIAGARVLIYGAAGSIGKEVAAQIFKRRPAALHMIDVSENNLVELVRDLRSSQGYIEGETLFLPLDMGSLEMAAFLATQKPYDYVLNLAAMKHVRSEKDAFSLMRMVRTNILDTMTTLQAARAGGTGKFFAVSTDKAMNPANLMGATKRIMEDCLFADSESRTAISTARFANVAFSDGSLLHGFRQRLVKRQPLSAPRDIRRYFVTGEESGELCLASLVLGAHREIFFPNLDAGLHLLTFSEIAIRFLEENGYEPVLVDSEDEARARVAELAANRRWPCHFFESDTSGEKPFEEFYGTQDTVDFTRFRDLGVIQAPSLSATQHAEVSRFLEVIAQLRKRGHWDKATLVQAITQACPGLDHVDTGRTLDNRM